MSILALKILAAYLLGSLSGSLLLGRRAGVDIRSVGSGNAGGTNALRTRGWRFALGVVLIDVGKGVAAAWLGGLGVDPSSAPIGESWQAALCGLVAMVGHVWPLYFQFRGGKAAATMLGAIAVIAPIGLLPWLLAWAMLIMATGYVGLATVAASLCLPIWMCWLMPDTVILSFTTTAALLIAYTHRDNLARLSSGTESRFERARLLARLLRRR